VGGETSATQSSTPTASGIASNDAFLLELTKIQPAIYLQFDGCRNEKYRVIRSELDIFNEKLKALERLVETGCKVVLIPAVERGVNEHEVGDIVPFGLGHPAVLGGIFSTGLSRWTAHAPRHCSARQFQMSCDPPKRKRKGSRSLVTSCPSLGAFKPAVFAHVAAKSAAKLQTRLG
jgi:hypothetical protein